MKKRLKNKKDMTLKLKKKTIKKNKTKQQIYTKENTN